MANREVVIVDGVRTAFGRLGGSLKDYTAEQLAGLGLKGLVEKTAICERGHIDSIFMGMAFHPTHAINPSRWAMLYAGIPNTTSASCVELQCGSSIDSIDHAAWKILCGQADIMVAGGMESFQPDTYEVRYQRAAIQITAPPQASRISTSAPLK